MPNYISVTQRGPDVLGLGDATKQGVKDQQATRFAAAALQHPALIALTDLVFPQSVADGTLTGVVKRHGHETVLPVTPGLEIR